MKKFLITSSIFIILLVIFDVLHYELGIFIDFHPNQKATTFVKTNGKDILLKNSDSKYETFEIKGVDMGAGMPGKFATDYAIDKETYKRWFKYIQDMGANTIRVYTILNDSFYNAFYEYNKNNDKPLYLIHGVWVNDYIQNSRRDAFDDSFSGQFLRDSKKLVDVIHGNSQITLGDESGTGFYFKDISPWVIGYILGVEWEDVTVAYTDDMQALKNSYQGKYMKTTKDASAFEAMLAEVGDKIIAYETSKYKQQRLVAFSNWPTTDPFTYSEKVKRFTKKIAQIDVEHIQTTKNFISGHFASYHIYPYYPDYLEYEEEYNDYKDSNGVKNTYLAYLEKINKHHKIPVVVSEFGVPASRGRAHTDKNTHRSQGGLNEQGQGQAIVDCYKDIKAAGINNAIIFSWQDEWFKRTWNTMHGVNLLKTPYWSDWQTNEQFFGLITFDPGEKRSVSYVDGSNEEWTKKDIILKNKELSLSAKYDEKFVYLYIKKKNKTDEKLYIPIDITPKSGSKHSQDNKVTFDRNSDFLIIIDGKDNSRILVQERYNTLNALFGYELKDVNSYLNKPAKDSDKFQEIHLILETMKITDLELDKSEAETYETGKLTFGTANPKSKNYNSLADFNIKDENIEIKIPWGLLNFSDPSNMMIHDDYYKYYGVEELHIDKMYIGAGNGDKIIKMMPLKLKPWHKNVTYHERLKKSYYIVQEMWKDSE